MAKVLVMFGGLAGVIGLFLPFVRVVDRLGIGAPSYDVRLWGGSPVVGIHEIFAFALLGFFLIVVLLGFWALSTRLGRGKAAAALVAAIPPTVICTYLLVRNVALGFDLEWGLGLVMVLGGAYVALIGGGLGLLRPDRRGEEMPAS